MGHENLLDCIKLGADEMWLPKFGHSQPDNKREVVKLVYLKAYTTIK